MELEMAELMSLRASFYSLLSRVYREETNVELLTDLAGNERLRHALEDLAGHQLAILEYLPDGATPPDFTELRFPLAGHYHQLFLGQSEAAVPTRASAYLRRDSGVTPDPLEAIEASYRTAGLELALDWRDAPDHLSAMLEFLGLLSLRTGKAMEDGQWTAATACLQQQREFVESYMLSWVPTFCGQVFNKSQSAYYKSFALITEEFVQFDRALILRSLRELERAQTSPS